jgi:hypothetical protein
VMAKKPKPRVRYVIDVEHFDGSFGIWDFKSFNDGPEALKFAESLAMNNPDMGVVIRVEPKFPKQNVLRNS